MLIKKRFFAYGYYDVYAGIYPKMNEIHLVVLKFDEIMNANNNNNNKNNNNNNNNNQLPFL